MVKNNLKLMRKLNLDDLKSGQPGISERMAGFLIEAAVVCLALNGHQSGVTITVTGDYKEEFEINWFEKLTEQKINSWKDLKEATEYGATAIALLLIYALENLVVKERLPQEGTSDYSLRTKDDSELCGQLEVSGIWKETKGNTPKDRVRIKINKLQEISKIDNFPVFVVVTEFSSPKSKIKKYGK